MRYKWHLILGFVFVAASNYFGVLIPQQIRKALDYVEEQIVIFKETIQSGVTEPSALNQTLFYFALTVIGFMILKGIFMYAMRQTIIVMSRLVEYDLRNDVFEHLEKMDLSFYKRHKTGDLMARISEDVNKVRMYLGPSILYGINLFTLFVMTITAMFQVNATLALYTLLPLPFLSLSIYFVSNQINRHSNIIQKQLSVLNSIAQEVYAGIRVVKSYVKEKQFGDYFESENVRYMDQSMSLAKVNAYFYPLMILLISISTLLTIYIGGLQVAEGKATAGNIAEFVIYVNMLTWPVTSIGWIASLMQQAEVSQGRINELMNQQPSIVNENQDEYPIEGKIEFKNVSFTFKDNGIKALNQVSFTIMPGQKIAIVGRTGSGKSTIADLLLRLYDIEEGVILIDDIPIKKHNIEWIRSRTGYIPQDVFLFSDTVSQNIRFGNQNALPDEVMEYAGFASVHDDIQGLPMQYETKIGERGVTLSGGQKQRISMARAFIKNPDIIIMDDALSAVDTKTEQKILSYLDNVLHNKTAIIITHRIYSLIEFDKIIVIDDGRLIETGTHDQLIKNKGFYAGLYEQQKLIDNAGV